ncbi:50S ribosomal protein L31e [Patescibacteria group bacterium]|nr:50S ribosomal protein L31e [Patescibacteria group bacterium]
MVDKKENPKLEREYVIPLRARRMHVPRYKKTPKSIKTIKEFLARHMKIYDRDLKKIKIDKYLNEFLWARGIKNPVHKIKVKAIKEGVGEEEVVRVELVDYTKNLKFKKERNERIEKQGEAKAKKHEEKKKEKTASESAEKKEEEAEKKLAVAEAGQKLEKAEHKIAKHETKLDKGPKHQKRQVLQK